MEWLNGFLMGVLFGAAVAALVMWQWEEMEKKLAGKILRMLEEKREGEGR